jgi:hypothetical protein
MQGFAAANLLLLTVVTFVVGVRLLLVARRTCRLPELLFGVAFVSGSLGTAGGQLGQRLPGPSGIRRIPPRYREKKRCPRNR